MGQLSGGSRKGSSKSGEDVARVTSWHRQDEESGERIRLVAWHRPGVGKQGEVMWVVVKQFCKVLKSYSSMDQTKLIFISSLAYQRATMS